VLFLCDYLIRQTGPHRIYSHERGETYFIVGVCGCIFKIMSVRNKRSITGDILLPVKTTPSSHHDGAIIPSSHDADFAAT
jgi:hypothetical protein